MGLFSRSEPKFPELVPVPAIADLPTPKLQSAARYLGTLTAEGSRVTGQSMAAKSSSRLHLSAEALDVVRMAGSFRIPVSAMRGATTAGEFAGRPVEALLVVRWEHGEQEWRTGFRLEAGRQSKKTKTADTTASAPDEWVRTISKMSRGNR